MSTSLAEHPEIVDRVEKAHVLAVPRDVRLGVGVEDFTHLCAANPDLRLERTVQGELIVMAPASPDGSRRNMALSAQLWNWNEERKLGVTFDSSAGFTLPNSAIRGPDASWMSLERWRLVPEADRLKFARVCPEFVVELRSPSNDFNSLHEKMQEYLDNGARLGWLIDPVAGTVAIYRPGRAVETLVKPASLSGEDVLPGFTLDLKGIL